MTHSPRSRLLLIDAGNTRVKCGVCAHPEPGAAQLPIVDAPTAVPCGANPPWHDLIGPNCAPRDVTAAIAGSNPHEVARLVREWPTGWPAPLVINDRRRFPLVIDVDFPDKVGIDRLLGAIAANVIRTPDQPAIIISSGTATTVDYLNERGHFCGGAILPGFELCAKALHQYTALLPLIEMTEVLQAGGIPAEIGRNTHAAITSGLYWGHVGAVKELLQRLTATARTGDRPQTAARSGNRTQQGSRDRTQPGSGDWTQPARPQPEQPHREPLILLTGGAALLLQPHLPTPARIEPHLALQGLALAVAHLTTTEATRTLTDGHPARPLAANTTEKAR